MRLLQQFYEFPLPHLLLAVSVIAFLEIVVVVVLIAGNYGRSDKIQDVDTPPDGVQATPSKNP